LKIKCIIKINESLFVTGRCKVRLLEDDKEKDEEEEAVGFS